MQRAKIQDMRSPREEYPQPEWLSTASTRLSNAGEQHTAFDMGQHLIGRVILLLESQRESEQWVHLIAGGW